MATIRSVVRSYNGPACPRCNAVLDVDKLRDGDDICANCGGDFEVRVLHPPQRMSRVLQVAQSGPEGAGACANHPRNAAVGNCNRCGVFICSLCELNVADGRFCPSCFDRLSEQGSFDLTKTRFRDYGGMALASGVIGFLFSIIVGIPLGILTFYYASKGFRDPDVRSTGRTRIVIGLLAGIAGFLLQVIMVWSMVRKG